MTVLSKTRAAGAAGLALVLILSGLSPAALAKPAEKAAASKSKSKASSAKKSTSKKKAPAKKASSRSKASTRKASTPSRASASRPAVEEKITGSALGRVVDSEGPPRSYVVKKGQGLDAVVRDTDLSRKQIADLNKLKEPFPLRPGQKLKLPPLKGKAYVPESGDSMAAIAKRFGLTSKALASYNNISRTAPPRPGRKILLPPGFKDSGKLEAPKPEERTELAYARPDSAPPSINPPVFNRPPPVLAPIQPQVNAPPPVLNPGDVASAGAGRFQWPLSGPVIQPFGTRAGQADDGITIGVPVGTPVRAAAGGTVIYSGRQIAEFGNYVLIQHEGGFLSAYGNMDRVNVRMNQKVAQGEQIGISGQTGTASQPQLHFEILYSARREDKSAPVDPMSLLPR